MPAARLVIQKTCSASMASGLGGGDGGGVVGRTTRARPSEDAVSVVAVAVVARAHEPSWAITPQASANVASVAATTPRRIRAVRAAARAAIARARRAAVMT